MAACSGNVTETDHGSAGSTDTETTSSAETVGGAPPPPSETEDALVPGTDYHATTILPCGFGAAAPDQQCEAGVKRNWGDNGDEALLEVTKPDGRKRAIFFKGTDPYGADSAQADGSAGWDFKFTRKGDAVTITYGPETYVIFDALITGG
ncbi:MAG: hypothetical protein ACO25F_04295 [Erythrobacter sp.]